MMQSSIRKIIFPQRYFTTLAVVFLVCKERCASLGPMSLICNNEKYVVIIRGK